MSSDAFRLCDWADYHRGEWREQLEQSRHSGDLAGGRDPGYAFVETCCHQSPETVQRAFADWVNREKQRPTRLWVNKWRPPTRSEIMVEKQKRIKLASDLQEVVMSLHSENRIAYIQKGIAMGDDQNHVHGVKIQICCSESEAIMGSRAPRRIRPGKLSMQDIYKLERERPRRRLVELLQPLSPEEEVAEAMRRVTIAQGQNNTCMKERYDNATPAAAPDGTSDLHGLSQQEYEWIMARGFRVEVFDRRPIYSSVVAHWTSIGPDSNAALDARSKTPSYSRRDTSAEDVSSLEWITDPVEWEGFPDNKSCDYADSIGVPWRHLYEYKDTDHGFVRCQGSAIEAKYLLSSWLKQEEQYDDDLLLSWSKLEKHRDDQSDSGSDYEPADFGIGLHHRKAIVLNTFKHIVDTLHHRGRLVFLEQKDADAGYMHIQVCYRLLTYTGTSHQEPERTQTRTLTLAEMFAWRFEKNFPVHFAFLEDAPNRREEVVTAVRLLAKHRGERSCQLRW
ncbi:hypothetical protein FFLO_03066 [Filobasidium floriforme]|uniref:Uncharacterized protein n=1 Tax=Filobasidium floriforme TaxID=5210 RepID=A0A8K0JLP0_9TREE|nr:hypothetical protein FFLO_03066 [Filobasidium floriforme]